VKTFAVEVETSRTPEEGAHSPSWPNGLIIIECLELLFTFVELRPFQAGMQWAAGKGEDNVVGVAFSSVGEISLLPDGKKIPVPIDTGGCLHCTFHISNSDADLVVPSGVLLPNGLASDSEQHLQATTAKHMQPTHVTRFARVGRADQVQLSARHSDTLKM
jgi:hypothetical protein